MVFISLISYAGSEGFGGQDWIPYPFDFIVIILVSLFFYVWAVNSRMTKIDPAAKKVNERLKEK